MKREDVYEMAKRSCPKEYGWFFGKDFGGRSLNSLSYDNNNPRSYGELKPKPNWRMVWRDNKAEIVVHGGRIGRVVKATFTLS